MKKNIFSPLLQKLDGREFFLGLLVTSRSLPFRKLEICSWRKKKFSFCESVLLNYMVLLGKAYTIDVGKLVELGNYVKECMPKYVQKMQIASGDELEILIAPDGTVPVMQFLKDNHNCQFTNLSDIAGMDVPSRPFRFEVRQFYLFKIKLNLIDLI